MKTDLITPHHGIVRSNHASGNGRMHHADSVATDRESDRNDPRTAAAAAAFGQLMDALGLDRSDPNLHDTEWRVARAYRELLAGLDEANEPALRTFPNSDGYRDIVAVTNIQFHSLCAHHFMPFDGVAHVAYMPGDRLVGLSKLVRAVDYFARRPQLQERLTQQVADLLHARLNAEGVMVVLEARHLCFEMRGVNKTGALTLTTAIHGVFQETTWRERAEQVFRARRPQPGGSEWHASTM